RCFCPGQCPGHVQDIEIFLGHCPIPALWWGINHVNIPVSRGMAFCTMSFKALYSSLRAVFSVRTCSVTFFCCSKWLLSNLYAGVSSGEENSASLVERLA